jgi:hypothetical protein
VLNVHGWGDIQRDLYDCSKRGAWAEMSDAIDDEMLDTFTIVTTPDAVADEVKARYGGLVDRITVGWWRKGWWPPVEEALRAL